MESEDISMGRWPCARKKESAYKNKNDQVRHVFILLTTRMSVEPPQQKILQNLQN